MPYSKTWRLKWDLFLINGFSFVLVGVIVLNNGSAWLHYLRVALALPFVLFFPGYALIAALFTSSKSLDGLERVALSFGLSLAVVPLTGLLLNYTPFGIRLIPILFSLVIFTFFLSVIALFRRRKLGREEVYYPVFQLDLPGWREMRRLDRFLSVVLVLAVLFTLGSAAYVLTSPRTGERFTEFFILGPGGKATDYPQNLVTGEPGKVIVEVVNHEHAPVTYHVEVVAGGYVKERTDSFQLSNGQKWEQPVSFIISTPQAKLKVEFLLFRQGDANPYQSLYLWVNARAPASRPALPSGVAVRAPGGAGLHR